MRPGKDDVHPDVDSIGTKMDPMASSSRHGQAQDGLTSCLLRLAAEDREEDWAILIRQQSPILTAVCSSILDGNALVEDAVQETILAIRRHLPEFRPKDDRGAQAWVCSIAGTVASHLARSERRRHHRERQWAEEADRFHNLPEPDPEHWEKVLGALAQLPATQRKALELRYLSGIKPELIAKTLGQTTPSAKTTLRRALSSLRSRLKAAVSLAAVCLFGRTVAAEGSVSLWTTGTVVTTSIVATGVITFSYLTSSPSDYSPSDTLNGETTMKIPSLLPSLALAATTTLSVIDAGEVKLSEVATQASAKYGTSVVTVQVQRGTPKNDAKAMAFPGNNEVLGTVIDSSGLTAVPLNYMTMNHRFGGGGISIRSDGKASQHSQNVEPTPLSYSILAADGTQIPSVVVVRDQELELIVLRPKTPWAKVPTPFVPAETTPPITMTDTVFSLTRAGLPGDRTLMVQVGRIAGSIPGEPPIWLLDRSLNTSFLQPVFAIDGTALGLIVARKPAQKSTDGAMDITINGSRMWGGSGNSVAALQSPAAFKALVEKAKKAEPEAETAPATPPTDPKPKNKDGASDF